MHAAWSQEGRGLDALAKGEEIPTADDRQTQSQDSQPKENATDKAIADTKAKGLVVLTGTIGKMNVNDELNLCVNLGVRPSEKAPGNTSVWGVSMRFEFLVVCQFWSNRAKALPLRTIHFLSSSRRISLYLFINSKSR